MGKPSAPPPPDYAAAATAQGKANENSALATNFLNQVSQVGPYGSLTYSYNKDGGMTLPDGTKIPAVTATTQLSPAQQQLLDQQNGISSSLNTLAQQGIGKVADAVANPLTANNFQPLQTSLDPANNGGTALRDQITDAYMKRLQPTLDQQQETLDQKLANQGIAIGSDAWNTAQNQNSQAVNDQRTAALLAGDQEQQNQFNNGLASANFSNQAQEQAIQEANYFQTQPLNLLNSLRTGNQATNPQFGNVSGGATIAAAPVMQAAQDQYAAAMQQYQAQLQSYNNTISGIAGIGGAVAGALPY